MKSLLSIQLSEVKPSMMDRKNLHHCSHLMFFQLLWKKCFIYIYIYIINLFLCCSSHLLPHSPSYLLFFQYNSSRPREEWEMWHPTLIAEALFAIANIFSSLRLISLFTANSHLGPLQISLGRMLLDILKFLFIYCLVRHN